MLKHIYDDRGETLLRTVEAEPECGEDFCDKCGDCLHCYEGDPCCYREDGQHLWIQYGEDEEDA